jgi:peptidoglycan biosynthesis protein MviN/MurJ (putative lipid II flippase)
MNTNTTHIRRRPQKPATIAASALIVSGLTGTVVDNDGTVGRALFIAAAAAALYLFGAWLWPRARRPHRSFSPFLRGRSVVATIAIGVAGLIGANFVKSTDGGVQAVLNRVFVAGFVAAAATIAVAAVLTVVNWIRPPEPTQVQTRPPSQQ